MLILQVEGGSVPAEFPKKHEKKLGHKSIGQ